MSFPLDFFLLPLALTRALSARETNEKRAREEDEEPVEDDPAEPTKKAKEDAEEAPEETPEAAPAAAPAEKKDERTFTPVVFLGHLPLNGELL